MNLLAKKRSTLFAAFTLVALTIGTALMTPSTASAQFRRGGFFGGRPYGGYGYGNVYNRGYGGYGLNSFRSYNRGYGGYGYNGLGYGNGLLNRGIYSNTIVAPFASPIGVNNFGYGGFGGGFGGLGGFN